MSAAAAILTRDASRNGTSRLLRRVIYAAYRAGWALLSPVALLYAAWRVIRNRAYAATIWERLGHLPKQFRRNGVGSIWIHAVSVGEILSAAALIRELRQRFEAPVFVSTTTLAGYEAGETGAKGTQ